MQQINFLIIIVLFLGGIMSTSCVKESEFSRVADSIKIAKIYQPSGLHGKDAVIESISADSCYGNQSYLTIFSWTNSGKLNNARTLIDIDMTDIPSNTAIISARLSLYWISFGNLTEHTGENSFSIYRIIEEWDEETVNWNNQPLISSSNVVSVSKSRTINQSYDIDVTGLVQDIINDKAGSHGFMLKLNSEYPFKSVILASSNYSESNKRPKLVVFY